MQFPLCILHLHAGCSLHSCFLSTCIHTTLIEAQKMHPGFAISASHPDSCGSIPNQGKEPPGAVLDGWRVPQLVWVAPAGFAFNTRTLQSPLHSLLCSTGNGERDLEDTPEGHPASGTPPDPLLHGNYHHILVLIAGIIAWSWVMVIPIDIVTCKRVLKICGHH